MIIFIELIIIISSNNNNNNNDIPREVFTSALADGLLSECERLQVS